MAGCAIARFANPVNKTNVMILIIENGFEFLYLKIGDLEDLYDLFGHTLTINAPFKKHLTGTSYIVWDQSTKNDLMKLFFSALLLSCLCFYGSLMGQTSIFTENFNNGCVSLCLANTYAGWSSSSTGTNGAFANDWYISCAENGMAPGNCGVGCGANATLHVSNAPGSPGGLCPTGDCGAAYDASLASVVSNRRVESPVIDCSIYSNIQLRFNFIAAQTDLPNDGFTVVYSSNGGTTWTTLGNGPASSCCCNFLDCFLGGCCAPSTTICGSLRQGNWAQSTLALPSSAANNPNVRVGFNWTNNGDNLGTDPSVAIDDLELIGDLVLGQQVLEFSGNLTPTGAKLHWEVDSESVHSLDLLHSSDGMQFETMAEFDRTDILESENGIGFFDPRPVAGISYYRLRTYNRTGQENLSQVLELHRKFETEVSIFPNPISQDENLWMKVQTPIEDVLFLQWIDLNGKVLKRKEYQLAGGSHQFSLEQSEFSPGVYYLKVVLSGDISYQKLVVY